MTPTPNSLPRKVAASKPRTTNYPPETRAMRRNRRTRENGARVAAVKLLHATAEGRCAHCDVLAPCPTQLALDFATVAARAPEEKRRTAERIADDAIRSMHRVAVSHPSFALTDKDHSE